LVRPHLDAQLGDDGDDSIPALAATDNIVSESVEDSGIDSDGTVEAVKVLSEKTKVDIKKIMESFRENQVSDEHDQEDESQLYLDFSEILSIEGSSAIN
jgi:exonuclease I